MQKEHSGKSHPASCGESSWQRVMQRTRAAFSRMCDSSDRTNSRYITSSANPTHPPDIVENAPNEPPRSHTSNQNNGASQMESQLSNPNPLTIDKAKEMGIVTDLSDTARCPTASTPTGRRALPGLDKSLIESTRVKALDGEVVSPESLTAKLDKISLLDLEETLKRHPGYEPNQEAPAEDQFVQPMLILKRGETDVDSTVKPRYAKLDTASPVSLVPQETLEGLGITPYLFPSRPLHGLDQSAIVEPIGMETIFWIDPKDKSEKPRVFATLFQVLPKGTNRSFDFLLGADWLKEAKLKLLPEVQRGLQTRPQPEVLCIRFLGH